jgi:hypothetical protein
MSVQSLAAEPLLTDPPPLEVVPEKIAPYERVAQVLAAAQRARVGRLSIRGVPDP